MKAIVKAHPEKGLEIQDIPMPIIKDDEVLIKVTHSSLCGTDLHIYNWDDWSKQNVTLGINIGHEFSGIIHSIGKNVVNLKEGFRVTAESHINCQSCYQCKIGLKHLCINSLNIGINIAGGFAEYIAVPERNIVVLPESIENNIGCILDPLGNAFHALSALNIIGKNILITGAGTIGIMSAIIARKCGAGKIIITDIDNHRLSVLKELGFTYAINTNETYVQDILSDIKIHNALEMSGNNNALDISIQNIENGGTISLLGIHKQKYLLDINKIIFKGITIKSIYGRKMFETWHDVINLVCNGLDITRCITHYFNYKDFDKAFEILASKAGIKVILTWA